MRTIFFYAHTFSWRAVDTAAEEDNFKGDSAHNTVVAFIHVEPDDTNPGKKIVSRFLKQIKQIARKWETRTIVLYSFAHLGEEKADIPCARTIIRKICKRLRDVDYEVKSTPFRCFVNFVMDSPGAPLSRAFRQF